MLVKYWIALFVAVGGISFAEEPEVEIAVVADILQITRENADEVLSQSSLPLIVDVNATWCNPCRMMNPIIDELSDEYEGKVQFAKVDFDSQNELAQKYNVTSLPTLLFFKPGKNKPVMKNVGFISKKELEAKIAEFIKK